MASRDSFAQAVTALVFSVGQTDDGDWEQAKANACNMQGGGGVKRFAKCPGCPNAPALKSVWYKDNEVPCNLCTKAWPFIQAIKRNGGEMQKLMNDACKRCK